MKIPENELERLAALRLYEILDSSSEEAFDDLTRLAASICHAPISLITFVDEKRQWFKSKVGLEVCETPREHAFCAHAIVEDDIMVVEDAHTDERFANNPLVTGPPHIRFYAGAPLRVADGVNLGALCVVDDKPRKLNNTRRRQLQLLSRTVVNQLEFRRAKNDLQAIESLLPICSWCRRIRASKENGETWQTLHEYIVGTNQVTHGMCPDCSGQFGTTR